MVLIMETKFKEEKKTFCAEVNGQFEKLRVWMGQFKSFWDAQKENTLSGP
jgi:hypothetical protein